MRFGVERVSPETGEHAIDIVLRTASERTCVVGGFLGVRLRDKIGGLPFRYRLGRGHYLYTHGPARPVLLGPHRWAEATIAKYRCDTGEVRTAHSVEITLPGERQAVRRGIARYAIMDYCRAYQGPDAHDPGNLVEIGPLRPVRPHATQ